MVSVLDISMTTCEYKHFFLAIDIPDDITSELELVNRVTVAKFLNDPMNMIITAEAWKSIIDCDTDNRAQEHFMFAYSAFRKTTLQTEMENGSVLSSLCCASDLDPEFF
ncbi:hypothetical protein RF11_14799 [Thelohanellus kitauei]|uniref:Uncharacterized protein n=1 Tax=Thelohanellus kitauei TaxID=669202 RepID=A0A0C2MZW2_THEKT|nr:hypothetical protein RF11_14799 [Thelohanellus kitauei]